MLAFVGSLGRHARTFNWSPHLDPVSARVNPGHSPLLMLWHHEAHHVFPGCSTQNQERCLRPAQSAEAVPWCRSDGGNLWVVSCRPAWLRIHPVWGSGSCLWCLFQRTLILPLHDNCKNNQKVLIGALIHLNISFLLSSFWNDDWGGGQDCVGFVFPNRWQQLIYKCMVEFFADVNSLEPNNCNNSTCSWKWFV